MSNLIVNIDLFKDFLDSHNDIIESKHDAIDNLGYIISFERSEDEKIKIPVFVIPQKLRGKILIILSQVGKRETVVIEFATDHSI